MAVRSAELAFAIDTTVGTRTTTIYTCPSGHVVIVKESHLTQGLGTPVDQLLQLLRGSTPATIVWESFATSSHKRNELWVVMEAGDVLRWTRTVASGGNCQVHVSGADLEL